METGTFGVSGQLRSILKDRILGLGKRVSCAKTGGLILTISTSYDMFLHKELPFGVTMIAPALKLLVTLIF